jgi:hypothetical protein
MRPMLGGVELQHVQRLEIDGDQVLVQHGVPALEGDFLQGLGRRGAQVTLAGVLTGPESGQGLKDLRAKFRAAEPVPFLADLSSATRVDQVLIEGMGVRELAGKPERFEYAFTLREYLPPAEPEVAAEQVEEGIQEQATEISSQQIDDISDALGTLEVQVNLGDGGDYSRIAVVVEGATADGEPFSTRIEEETDGVYRLEDIRAGTYTVRAVVR